MSKELGKAINDYRTECKMTQSALAKQLNISPTTLSRYESGSRVPKPDSFRHMLRGLGIEDGSKDHKRLWAIWMSVARKEHLDPPAFDAHTIKGLENVNNRAFSKWLTKIIPQLLKVSPQDRDAVAMLLEDEDMRQAAIAWVKALKKQG